MELFEEPEDALGAGSVEPRGERADENVGFGLGREKVQGGMMGRRRIESW